MSRFDAVYLHEVVDYKRWGNMPDLPDFKSLQKRLDTAMYEADHGYAEKASDEISGIKSDYDFDDSLGTYVDKSAEKIQELHGVLRNAVSLLAAHDFETLSRKQMINLVEKVYSDLEDGMPQGKLFRDMLNSNWFPYYLTVGIGNLLWLKNRHLSYSHGDFYEATVASQELGGMKMQVFEGGVLKLETEWEPSTLTFTRDGKIHMQGPDNSFTMRLGDFRDYFSDWVRPTEEEIALFDVLHPGADFTVLRYLRDYTEIIAMKSSGSNPIVAVTTSL